MKKILVGYSDAPWSATAAKAAVDLAKTNNARLELAYVSRPPPRSVEKAAFADEFAQIQRRFAFDLFEDAQAALTYPCETRHVIGKPAEELIRLTDDPEVELVVVGTRPRTGVAKLFYGGTAHRVAQHAQCSTLIVHARDDKPPAFVATSASAPPVFVVGCDGSESSLTAVNEAVSLAGLTGARLHLVTVIEPWTTMAPTPASHDMNPERRREAQSILFEARAGIQESLKVTTAVRVGLAPDELLAEASEQAAPLIVLGASGRGAANRLLFGSVTAELVHSAPMSVLVARARTVQARLDARG